MALHTNNWVFGGMGNGERDNALKTTEEFKKATVKERIDWYSARRKESGTEKICDDGYACLAPDCPCPGSYDTADSFHFFETLMDEVDTHASSKQFYNHLIEAGLLHRQKQSDYGKADDPFANVRASEEWGIPGWVGAMVRAQDKVRRLQTHALRGSLVNESVKDSLLDLAVYSLIALVLYEQDEAAKLGKP